MDGRVAVREPGRAARLWAGLIEYVRLAVWGLVAPRVTERGPLRLAQAVVREAGGPEGATAARRVLLSMRSDLLGWELPGGTVEPGETWLEALHREVREETGLEVEIEGLVGRWRRTGFRPHEVRVYRCVAIGGRLRPSAETPRVGWFPEAAPPDGLFPWAEAPLERARTAEAGPVGADPPVFHERQGPGHVLRAMRIDLGMRWRGLPPQRLLDGSAGTR